MKSGTKLMENKYRKIVKSVEIKSDCNMIKNGYYNVPREIRNENTLSYFLNRIIGRILK